jgi:hypothetical protein
MKKLLTALVILVSASCGPAPLCTTRCGLNLDWKPPEADESWTCDNLQRTEDLTVEAFKSVLDDRFQTTCDRIKNKGIYIVGARHWKNSSGKTVAGETYCLEGYVFVYNAEPWNIALPHELAHVVQGCLPQGPYDVPDLSHANWDRDGINTAVQNVKTNATTP